MPDQSTAENAEISSQLYEKKKKDLKMSCFNPLADVLSEPLRKRFANLSESQLDVLVSERHWKKRKDVTNCIKQIVNGSGCTMEL